MAGAPTHSIGRAAPKSFDEGGPGMIDDAGPLRRTEMQHHRDRPTEANGRPPQLTESVTVGLFDTSR